MGHSVLVIEGSEKVFAKVEQGKNSKIKRQGPICRQNNSNNNASTKDHPQQASQQGGVRQMASHLNYQYYFVSLSFPFRGQSLLGFPKLGSKQNQMGPSSLVTKPITKFHIEFFVQLVIELIF